MIEITETKNWFKNLLAYLLQLEQELINWKVSRETIFRTKHREIDEWKMGKHILLSVILAIRGPRNAAKITPHNRPHAKYLRGPERLPLSRNERRDRKTDREREKERESTWNMRTLTLWGV